MTDFIRRIVALGAALTAAIALLTATTSTDARAATPARPTWTVRFHNSYSKRVFVAIKRFNAAMCGEYGGWETKGWWSLQPGETKTVTTTDDDVAGVYFYAKAEDGSYVWQGNGNEYYGPTEVNDGFMDWCRFRRPADTHTVQMRQVKLPAASLQNMHPVHTVTLMY